MAAPIILTIASVFKSAGLNQARTAVLGAGKDFGALAKQIGVAAGSFGAFQALTSSKAFISDAIEQTQKFERNILALKQTFEGAFGTINNFTKQVEDYGISQQQAAQASIFLGSVLKQYGFSVTESADETQRLVTLSQDLATTYGYDLQDALLAITALFRGEYDPIEKFGVAMKQNEINALLTAQGLGKLTGAERANAEATARLSLLFERADDSVGAFTRAADTLYVAQSKLAAVTGNLTVAFGEPLQKPIAKVTDGLADIAQSIGPEFVEVSDALADGITNLSPLFLTLAETLRNTIVFMQPVVELLSGLASLLAGPLNAALTVFNSTMKFAIQFFDTWSATIGAATFQLKELGEEISRNPFVKFLLDVAAARADKLFSAVGDAFAYLNDNMVRNEQAARGVSGDFETVSQGARASSTAAREAATAYKIAARAAADAAPELTYFQRELERVGLYTKDAEGELTGLAAVFAEIGEVAAKSKAADEFKLMGFNASQIAYFLTQPDWASIFGNIARLARYAAMDINKMSYAGLVYIGEQKAVLDALLAAEFGSRSTGPTGGSSPKEEAVDYVKKFFDSLQEEVNKQTARLQLQKMTGSKGLIEQILGSENFMDIWIQIKQGIISLGDLEKMFYRTAAGAQELADAAAAWDEYDLAVKAVNDRLVETIANIVQQAEDLKLTFTDLLSAFDVLPTIAIEMGSFEKAVVSQLENIERSLQSAFRNGDLFEAGYNQLRKFAQQELQVLQAIQRQRDDMAERYSLSKALISEYETALTGALNLTSLFNALKDETETRTITEVTRGVVSLAGSLKEFNVVVTRDYEETIQKVQDKTAGLLDGFKNMATKARDFAANLRTLRDMGLDPQLFNQLVQAGVEAGGQTAQALVDGGSETVGEISGIFAEINQLGADLGEEVAATLYGTGIDLVDGLIEGIMSEQERLEAAAYAMAEAFNTAFQATLSTEIGKVTSSRVAEATQAAADEIAKIPVPDMPRVNPALEELDKLIAGANKALGGNLSSVFREGVTGKLGAFEALRKDIESGSVSDLGGLTKNLTSAEVESISRGTGGQTVNNYYNIVSPPSTSRVESYSQGQATESGIIAFKTANSRLTTTPIGG
jgi:hypothetical protein